MNGGRAATLALSHGDAIPGVSAVRCYGHHMRRFFLLLVLAAVGWTPLSGVEAAGPVEADVLVEQARLELLRAPVDAGRYSEDQLALALHLQFFGAQAPRADLPLALFPAVLAAAKAGDEHAKAEIRDRWFLYEAVAVAVDGAEEAHARRCPPAVTCLQLWTMWNHVPAGRTKLRWLPILHHALRVGMDEKSLATIGPLLGEDTLARQRYMWSNGLDAFGDWGEARNDPLRRREMLLEVLHVRSQRLLYFTDDLWLDALESSDFQDPAVVEMLLQMLRQQSQLLIRLARFARPDQLVQLVDVRTGETAPLRPLLRAVIQPDQAGVQPIIASLAVAMTDGGWEGYPSDWRHPSSQTEADQHVLRLIDHGVWRMLWRDVWRGQRGAAALHWAAALPQMPAWQAAQLISMLPPASSLDDPLLLAALAHSEPRVRILAAQQAARLDPTLARLEAYLDLWDGLDALSRNWQQDLWLEIVGLAVHHVAGHNDADLRARLQRSARAESLLAPELRYTTGASLSAWSELLGAIGLRLPVAQVIDRYVRSWDEKKGWYSLESLIEPYLLEQPAQDEADLIGRMDGWPAPIRMHALAFAGRCDAALALWDVAANAKQGWAIRPLIWSRRTEAMVKAEPAGMPVLLGWAEGQGQRPVFDPDDLGSRFHRALYRRLVLQAEAQIPWNDWRFSLSYSDLTPVLMLDAQRMLRPDDIPRMLSVLAKRGVQDERNQAALASVLRQHNAIIPEELVRRSPVCAGLRLEQAFQSGAWEEVLRRAEALPTVRRYGSSSLRRGMALQRLVRLDGKARDALLPELEPFQRTLLAEWLLGEGDVKPAQEIAATVVESDLEPWQRRGWALARIRLALAAGAPAAARAIHAAAYAEVRDSESWAHLEQLGELIQAAAGADGEAIGAWAIGGWRRDADEGIVRLEGWRTKAVSPAWQRALTWALAVAHARAAGVASEPALTEWQKLADGQDWWAHLAKRSLAAAVNQHRRLMPTAGWSTRRRLDDLISCSEPMFGLPLNPEQGKPPAIGERAVMIDPWGEPELLYRRQLLGPWTGWYLYLDGYRPMVRSGTWLHLSRVDGVEELHLLRLAPVAVPNPPPPPPQAPPAPVRLRGILPLILRLGIG